MKSIHFSICLLALFLLSFRESKAIEKVTISNGPFVDALNNYVDSNSFFSNSNIQACVLLSIEGTMHEGSIYISATDKIEYFRDNVPEQYAIINGLVIFIFTDQLMDISYQYENFIVDFNRYFRVNDPDEIISLYYIHPEHWKVQMVNDLVVNIRKVQAFPSNSFNEQYKMDNEGYVRYHDNVYAWPEIPASPPEGISFSEYVKNHVDLSIVPDLRAVVLIFVINEEGMLSDFEFIGFENEDVERDIVKTLKNMPPWTPAQCGGQLVTSRERWGLTGIEDILR